MQGPRRAKIILKKRKKVGTLILNINIYYNIAIVKNRLLTTETELENLNAYGK